MKLKMVEPGFAGNYSGTFGTIEFVDGVSVEHVSKHTARELACYTSMEWLEDGMDPGDNANYQVSLHKEAVSVNYPTLDEIAAANSQVADEAVKENEGWTQEQLEQLADKSGLNGLREVGDKFGVKSTSIAKLIQAILQAQTNAAAQAPAVTDLVATELQPEG